MTTLSNSDFNISDLEKGKSNEGYESGVSIPDTIVNSSPSPSPKGGGGGKEAEGDEGNKKKESRLTQLRSSNGFLSFTVALGFFVDLLCYGIIMPLTPFIVQNLGLDSTANGALIACYAAGLLIASPIVGVISDRIVNRRTPMIVGLIALFLSMIMFMEALNHFWLLLVARFFAGLAGGTVMTLGFALLSDTYPANRLGIEMGKVMIGHTFGMMAGPPLGGILQEKVGIKAPYVFCLILIAIDLIARVMIIESRSVRVKALKRFQEQQKQEAKSEAVVVGSGSENDEEEEEEKKEKSKGYFTTLLGLLKNKRLATALYVSFLNAFLLAAVEPVLPLYLEERFHLTESQIGLTFLALSVPAFVSPLSGWLADRHGGRMISFIAIALCAVFVVLLGLPNNPLWAIIVLLFLVGATCATYITPVLGEISAVVRVTGEGDGFARAYAMFNMCFSIGMVVGPILGALVYQKSEMIWTCVLVAAIGVIGLPVVLMYMGNKAQKLKDQEQYESDMRNEEEKLLRIEQDRKRRMIEKNDESDRGSGGNDDGDGDDITKVVVETLREDGGVSR
ncbi:hypothetical protein BGZ76_002823 [Entomortierella beljakovae]|nr:hypothetical protein BGZ76_002823 [Entomortierella beljakovae]